MTELSLEREKPPTKFPKPVIFHLYLWYLDKYQAKYGPKTIVLMQVGGFYEAYGVDNGKVKLGMAKEIGALLHIEVPRRNKENPVNNIENYLMAGFPLAALSKYIDILMEENYTVVVVEQEGTAEDKENAKDLCPRYVSEIYSPGTYFPEDQYGNQGEHKYLIQIHLEGYPRRKKDQFLKINYQPMVIGLAAIDVTTGENDVYEVSNFLTDSTFALDEIYRYLQTHQPKEILLTSHNLEMEEQELLNYLDLQGGGNIRCQISYNQVKQEYYRLPYQKQLLNKLFPDRSNMLSIIEYLDLERTPSALLAYILLLQYAYEHNEKLVRNLSKPRTWENQSHLLLANNAITQMDLANNNRNRLGSVVNLLNLTSTSMGKRLFQERLLNPVRDPVEISRRYDRIDRMIVDDFWRDIEKALTGMLDLDRLHRRIEIGTMSPNGFNLLMGSYDQVAELLEVIPDDFLPSPDFRQKFADYCRYLTEVLDFDETRRYSNVDQIKDNIFTSGHHQKLSELSDSIRQCHRYLEVMITKMSNLIEDKKGTTVVKKRQNELIGTYLYLTGCRYQKFLDALAEQKQPGKLKGELHFRVESRKFILSHDTFEVMRRNKDRSVNLSSQDIQEISKELESKVSELQKVIHVIYSDFMTELQEKYRPLYAEMSQLVAEVDVYKASAKAAIKYGYTRPRIVSNKSTDGQLPFVRAINFRHPLVERINQKTEYVPHSLQLGENNSEKISSNEKESDEKESDEKESVEIPEMNGLLLYGVNASGKTCCMKAIGVNLVMAQAGMYVAADDFTYSPYAKILTRILGNDNIFKGLSSFAVEMTELRGILRRADQKSLILGDEICHGTETISGVSIVASSLKRLTDHKAQFIFATHLHQLNNLEIVQKLPNLGVYHMHVEYNPQDHKLIYYRDLREGPGNPLYGIEVARAMDLDEEFLSTANQIRQEMMDQDQDLLPAKRSRYNAQVYVDQCLLCDVNKAKDTHHIKFQCTADSNGMIGSMYKHEAKNLVPLCKECHVKVHQGLIEVRGYLETSAGLLLDYTINQSTQASLAKRPSRLLATEMNFGSRTRTTQAGPLVESRQRAPRTPRLSLKFKK